MRTSADGGRATAQVGPKCAGQPAALRAGHTQSPLQLRHPQNTGSDGAISAAVTGLRP
jgi:hypothetical protein